MRAVPQLAAVAAAEAAAAAPATLSSPFPPLPSCMEERAQLSAEANAALVTLIPRSNSNWYRGSP